MPRDNNQSDEGTESLYICVLCAAKGIPPTSKIVLSRFPLDPAICRSWVQNVGIKELADKTLKELNETKFLCQAHFNSGCYIESGKSIFLRPSAVPTVKLYYPTLPLNALVDFPKKEVEASSLITESAVEELLEIQSDIDEAVYLEEFPDKSGNPESELDHPKRELTNPYRTNNLSLDEIDTLFLSYAGTFKKLTTKLQTMVKLDMAKLFARYEMKNAAFLELTKQQPKQQDETKVFFKPQIAQSTTERTKLPITDSPSKNQSLSIQKSSSDMVTSQKTYTRGNFLKRPAPQKNVVSNTKQADGKDKVISAVDNMMPVKSDGSILLRAKKPRIYYSRKNSNNSKVVQDSDKVLEGFALDSSNLNERITQGCEVAS